MAVADASPAIRIVSIAKFKPCALQAASFCALWPELLKSEPVRIWDLLRTGARSAGENMALDEALLEAAPQLNRPVLRFYSWTELAATFGYFQRFRDVEKMTPLRPLIRRPTGGGLV